MSLILIYPTGPLITTQGERDKKKKDAAALSKERTEKQLFRQLFVRQHAAWTSLMAWARS